MRRFLALLLCILVPSVAFASEPSNTYKVGYDGGSVLGIKSGQTAHLQIAEKEIRLIGAKDEVIATIPAGSVTEISYGQDVHRRIGTAIGLAVI